MNSFTAPSELHAPVGREGDWEDPLTEFINAARSRPDRVSLLLPLLRENHPVYHERSTAEAARIRGFILVALGGGGLPPEGVVHALDELENSREPFLTAAAARALRGAEQPEPSFAPFLLRAIENVRDHDDTVCLDDLRPVWPPSSQTTAMAEIIQTLRWMRGAAGPITEDVRRFAEDVSQPFTDSVRNALRSALLESSHSEAAPVTECCGWRGTTSRRVAGGSIDLTGIVLENEASETVNFRNLIRNRVTILAFFYTRCSNPNKCSLTVAKLALIQREITNAPGMENVQIAGVTYDPQYDGPERLAGYGANRGLKFNGSCHLYRAIRGWDTLQKHFDLGVGFAGSTVNRHQIEMLLVDGSGNLIADFNRLRWDIPEVLRAIESSETAPPKAASGKAAASGAVASSAALLFIPKCPMCWAAYLGAFGISGASVSLYKPWILAAALGSGALTLYALFRAAQSRNGWWPFGLSLVGMLWIGCFTFLAASKPVAGFGLGLVIGGAVLNALPSKARFGMGPPLESIQPARGKIAWPSAARDW